MCGINSMEECFIELALKADVPGQANDAEMNILIAGC
jgi:hypothetical protein